MVTISPEYSSRYIFSKNRKKPDFPELEKVILNVGFSGNSQELGPDGPISESSIFQNSSEFQNFSECLDTQIFFRILDAEKSRCVFNWFPCIAFHTAFFSRNRYQPRFFSRNRYQPRNPKISKIHPDFQKSAAKLFRNFRKTGF